MRKKAKMTISIFYSIYLTILQVNTSVEVPTHQENLDGKHFKPEYDVYFVYRGSTKIVMYATQCKT